MHNHDRSILKDDIAEKPASADVRARREDKSVQITLNRAVLEVSQCRSESVPISWEQLVPDEAGPTRIHDLQRPKGILPAINLDLEAVPLHHD